MNAKQYRKDPCLLRNEFPVTKELQMPIIESSVFPSIDKMLSFHDTRNDDKYAKCIAYLVHFFKDDYRFAFLYDRPYEAREINCLKKLAQYAAVCTPDFSLYPEMPLTEQRHQVFKSRWCGARWQSVGLRVIPTVTWGEPPSFSFCFDGIQPHSVVAVSTVGNRYNRKDFLSGYNKMLEVIQPELIVCYGQAFEEMDGEVIEFAYEAFRRRMSA